MVFAATTHAHRHTKLTYSPCFLKSKIFQDLSDSVISKLTTLDHNPTATDWVNAPLNCESTHGGVTLG